MANIAPRIIRASELPAASLSLTDAFSGAYNVEPVVVAETGQFAIVRIVDAVPYSAYLVPAGIKQDSNILSELYALPFLPYVFPAAAGYAATAAALWLPLEATYARIVYSLVFTTIVATTSDATHYWAISVDRLNTDNTTSTMSSYDTKTHTADVVTKKTLSGADLLFDSTLTTSKALIVTATKNSTPGALQIGGFAYVRDILA